MPSNENSFDYVKAFTDTDRLRIVGLLTQRPANLKEISAELNIPFKEAFNHIAFMKFLGVVRQDDDIYTLNPQGMEEFARQQFTIAPEQKFSPDQALDEKTRKVLANFINADGSIKRIPAQQSRLMIILDYLVEAFTPGVNYTEKEVNTIIRRYHSDTAFLRRALVEAGMLMRESDCSKYWRPEVNND